MSVNLTKGQTVSLTKSDGGTLTQVRMGLGWDAIKVRGLFGRAKEKSVDLDASALLFDANGALVDQVWFSQLASKDGAVQHTGDNRTGAGDGDDESIRVALTGVNPAVKTLVFVVNSYTGETFAQMLADTHRRVNATDLKDPLYARLAKSDIESARAKLDAATDASARAEWSFPCAADEQGEWAVALRSATYVPSDTQGEPPWALSGELVLARFEGDRLVAHLNAEADAARFRRRAEAALGAL